MGKWVVTYGIAAAGIVLAGRQAFLTGEYLLFAAVLAAVSASDVRYRIVPDALLAAALAVRAAYLAFCAIAPGEMQVQAGDCAGQVLQSIAGMLCLPAILAVAASLVRHTTGRISVGGGDVKLFAVAGAYFGLPAGLAVMLASCLFALPIAAIQRLYDIRAGRCPDGTFPFAPAIALACWAGMLAL